MPRLLEHHGSRFRASSSNIAQRLEVSPPSHRVPEVDWRATWLAVWPLLLWPLLLWPLLLRRNHVRFRPVIAQEVLPVPTNKGIVEEAYANFATGNVPAVLAIMDPKIEWTEAEGFPPLRRHVHQAIVDGVLCASRK
jgi:hypothetical protein